MWTDRLVGQAPKILREVKNKIDRKERCNMFGNMPTEEVQAYLARLKKANRDIGLKNDLERKMSTTESRYASRAYNIWDHKRFGTIRHRFWWVVHNSIIHPILGVIPCRLTFELHDWASKKLNGK